jgi:3-hydroxyacyl-CoA dehydrogenase
MNEINPQIVSKVEGMNKVTVLGAGTMGSGITRLFTIFGYHVRVVDPFEKNLANTAAIARIPEDRLFPSLTPEAISDADLIIEAVTEDPQLKKEQVYDVLSGMFEKGHLKDGLIISSNTSSIPIKLLAESLPQEIRTNFLGTHFFNPAHHMKLIELIRGPDTSDVTYQAWLHLSSQKLWKEIATAADLPGFIVNRLLLLDYGNVFSSLENGEYTIEEIDYVMGIPVGRPMGFFQLADLIGNDLLPPIAKVIHDGIGDDPYKKFYVMPDFLHTMVEKKLLGVKTGGLGFYKSEKRKAVAVYDIEKNAYREIQKPKFDSVEGALREKDVVERVWRLINPDKEDRGSEIAKRFLGLLFEYTQKQTGIIGEADDIETAMTYGLNHRVGPVGFLESEKGEEFKTLYTE